MNETARTSDLIVALLRIGATLDLNELFRLFVREAPKLVGAEECSIFWKAGPWLEPRRHANSDTVPEAYYRRATHEAKQHLIGVDYYLPGEGLTGWVAKHGKTLRIDDIANAKELQAIASDLVWKDKYGGFRDSTEPHRQKAFLAVPISMETEVVGVIRIAKTKSRLGKFRPEDVKLLEAFASNISAIIKRAEESRQKSLWETLYFSGIGPDEGEFSNYMQKVADAVPEYLGAKACSIFLLEQGPRGMELKLRATTAGGPLEGSVGEVTYALGEGLTGWVAQRSRSLRLNNVDDQNELASYDPDLRHKGKHEEYVKKKSSFLACPLEIGGRPFGVVRVAQDAQGKAFSSSDQRFLEYFCRNLAVLVQNSLLIRRLQSEKDMAVARLHEKTKLLNQLGKSMFEEFSSLRKSLADLLPDVRSQTQGLVRIGPVLIESKPRDRNSVFIGIPFSTSATNVFHFGIKPALEKLRLHPWHAAEQPNQIEIMRNIFEGIQQSHIAVVDISDWNPNVLFELGVLYGQDHPVILLKREDAKVPADLAGLEYLAYGDFGLLSEHLAEQIQDMLERSS